MKKTSSYVLAGLATLAISAMFYTTSVKAETYGEIYEDYMTRFDDAKKLELQIELNNPEAKEKAYCTCVYTKGKDTVKVTGKGKFMVIKNAKFSANVSLKTGKVTNRKVSYDKIKLSHLKPDTYDGIFQALEFYTYGDALGTIAKRKKDEVKPAYRIALKQVEQDFDSEEEIDDSRKVEYQRDLKDDNIFAEIKAMQFGKLVNVKLDFSKKNVIKSEFEYPDKTLPNYKTIKVIYKLKIVK